MKMEALALTLVTTLVFTFLFCGILVQPVDSQSFETIYIRPDGSIEGTDKIQRDGEVYTFVSDISGSIIVERDNSILNGEGYVLQGDGNENGLTLGDIGNTTVKNLKLSNFNIGILVMSSNDNEILEITITDSFRGLDLTASENNTVSGNYIANNKEGIAIENIYNNIVENAITNNSDVGIFLNGAGYNNIIGNNITNNKRGIVVSICYDNVIYHNNFVNNVYHVETDNSNGIWDNGNEGNYWSDYATKYPNATETDGSGIWNTPYVISENNQDNYPLIDLVETPDFPDEADEAELFAIIVVISLIVIALVAIGIFILKEPKR